MRDMPEPTLPAPDLLARIHDALDRLAGCYRGRGLMAAATLCGADGDADLRLVLAPSAADLDAGMSHFSWAETPHAASSPMESAGMPFTPRSCGVQVRGWSLPAFHAAIEQADPDAVDMVRLGTRASADGPLLSVHPLFVAVINEARATIRPPEGAPDASRPEPSIPDDAAWRLQRQATLRLDTPPQATPDLAPGWLERAQRAADINAAVHETLRESYHPLVAELRWLQIQNAIRGGRV